MKNPAKTMTALYFFFLILILPAFCDSPGIIRVNEESHVVGDKVYLKDIAIITAGESATQNPVGDVLISQAPPRGQYIRMSKRTLSLKLRNAGFKEGDFKLEAPSFFKIARKTAYATREDVMGEALKFLVESKKESEDEFIPMGTTVPRKVPLSSGEVSYKCEIGPGLETSSRIPVHVVILCDGVQEKEFSLVFRRPSATKKGEKKTVAPRDEGEAADKGAVASIRRGDRVKVLIHRKNMEIALEGAAVESARMGENVRVRTSDGTGTLQGVLIDQNTVKVDL